MILIEEIKLKYGNAMALVILIIRCILRSIPEKDIPLFIKRNSIDWEDLIIICRRQSIRIQVFDALLKYNIPNEISFKIKNEFRELKIKNLSLFIEADRVFNFLKKNQLDYVPYKGFPFAHLFYRDVFARELSDIDIIVNPSQLSKIVDLFKADGYILIQEQAFTKLDRKEFIKEYRDLSFQKNIGLKNEFHIEIHWKIVVVEKYFSISGLNTDFNLNEYNRIQINGTEIKVLNEVENIRTILLHHILHDSINSLKHILDVAKSFNFINENSESNLDISSLTKLNDTLNLGIIMSSVGLITGVECKTLGVKSTNKTPSHIINSILENRKNPISLLTSKNRLKRLKYYFLHINSRVIFFKGIISKFIFIFKYIFYCLKPGLHEFEVIRLPKYLIGIYWIIRPFRFIIKPNILKKK
jgi:hypothetical protein